MSEVKRATPEQRLDRAREMAFSLAATIPADCLREVRGLIDLLMETGASSDEGIAALRRVVQPLNVTDPLLKQDLERTLEDLLRQDAARDGLTALHGMIADDEVTDGGDEPIKSVTMFTLEFDDTRDFMDEETIRRKILGR